MQMDKHRAAVMILEGGEQPQAEKLISSWMRAIRDRITIETIKKLQRCTNISMIVCTNRESIQTYCLANRIDMYDTSLDPINHIDHIDQTDHIDNESIPQPGFDYLHTIQAVCKDTEDNHDSVLVLGGTALPLATVQNLQYLIDTLAAGPHSHCVWANNPISPDVVGWSPIYAIREVNNVQNDNELAAALRDQAGLAMRLWDRELALTYDIDTPSDVLAAEAILGESFLTETVFPDGNLSDHMEMNTPYAEYAKVPSRIVGTDNSVSMRYTGVLTIDSICDPVRKSIHSLLQIVQEKKLPSLTLIGRVSPQTVQFVNQQLKAKVRVYSEERGMKGLRRDREGKVWSLVADWFERFPSYEDAFAQLAHESDGILIDTRVWMAHHKLLPVLDEEERFASDLLLADLIQNEKLKRFTEAARTCSVPVLLGGFGLVNQGVQLLFQTLTK
jgi:hypothetical protein